MLANPATATAIHAALYYEPRVVVLKDAQTRIVMSGK
jgi:hypothetical protein